MLGDLAIRFVVGGTVVSAFSAIAEMFQPKTFSGLFGAAPSVALATLTLTYTSEGAGTTAIAARWMAIGSLALFAYASLCVVVCRSRRIPVWLGAVVSWIAWLGLALALYLSIRHVA